MVTLLGVFEAALRMLSPFMPFITEEIWHAFYDGTPPVKSIALTRYPRLFDEHLDADVEREMSLLQELIAAVRAARKDLGVEERAMVPIRLRTGERVGASWNSIWTSSPGWRIGVRNRVWSKPLQKVPGFARRRTSTCR
jgi:valyl-tRNA synthetase